jgi:hypothetical protein
MKKILIIAITAIAFLTSCTDNARARQFGGTETIDIPEGRILVNCTWKEADLWILTKDTATGEMFFNEKSSFGILEGEINFK